MPEHKDKKQKKKRLSKFSFENDGCAVALVGDFQGGPANGVTTLVTKSTSDITEEELEKNLTSSVDSQDEDVVKTEDETNNVKPEEEVTKMTEENKVSDESIREMIQKAVEEEREEIRKSLVEEFEAKDKERAAELEILKAKDEAREEKAFIAKAADYKEHLGSEEAEQHEAVQALAKALRKMEADEECKPALDLLKSLKDTVEKSALLDEVGGTSIEKSSDYETEGDKLVMKMVKEQGISEAEAYAKMITERPDLF